ncbi:phosphomevalonate kinase [Epargyreus clarus]|uniref:phosphomevalonate kinase n=1 Tax=Epargyreus clarus TaxID=520877 RepID=UPI003C2F97D0
MPNVILLFSGKRKSGKDYLTEHLCKILGEKCEVIKISQPIKSHWAKERNLDLQNLLSDGPYKEQYRIDMINWSDEMRDKDYGCFCRAACKNAADKPVWVVSDVRRKTDVQWFKENYGDLLKLIRIVADEGTRKERGFIFKHGVDDVPSECGLDDFDKWDLIIDNGKGRQTLEEQLELILSLIPKL